MKLTVLLLACTITACHIRAPESPLPGTARVEVQKVVHTADGSYVITVNAYRMYRDGAKDLIFSINNTEVRSCKRVFVSWNLYARHNLTPSEDKKLREDDEIITCTLDTEDELELIKKPGPNTVWAVIRNRRKVVIASDSAPLDRRTSRSGK
jgi:hypothetical protein